MNILRTEVNVLLSLILVCSRCKVRVHRMSVIDYSDCISHFIVLDITVVTAIDKFPSSFVFYDAVGDGGDDDSGILAAICEFTPTMLDTGSTVGGYVRFSRDTLENPVAVEYQISGLDAGEHEW